MRAVGAAPRCMTLGHEDRPAAVTGMLLIGDGDDLPRPARGCTYCQECADALDLELQVEQRHLSLPGAGAATAYLRADEVERWCKTLHDAYEAAAAELGWQTQERSRVPWAQVPIANRASMRAAVTALAPLLAEREALAAQRGRAAALSEVRRTIRALRPQGQSYMRWESGRDAALRAVAALREPRQ